MTKEYISFQPKIWVIPLLLFFAFLDLAILQAQEEFPEVKGLTLDQNMVGGESINSALVRSAYQIETLKAQAFAGDLTAVSQLHSHYAFGLSDELVANQWLRFGASLGKSDMQIAYGLSKLESSKDEFDRVEGLSWLARAAEGGDTDGAVQIANIYRSGKYGVRKDKDFARCWDQFADDAGTRPVLGKRCKIKP